jgi:hypothetical protein
MISTLVLVNVSTTISEPFALFKVDRGHHRVICGQDRVGFGQWGFHRQRFTVSLR